MDFANIFSDRHSPWAWGTGMTLHAVSQTLAELPGRQHMSQPGRTDTPLVFLALHTQAWDGLSAVQKSLE